ncbi:NUDIX hydrolase [Streptosporangium sp. NPDC006007]|uniref:NUDIX hydrolase n=1 Tax=Streptosporangium sp. NPDC006007 TaxID=3154575 RepID=UPI0033A8479D
MRWQVNSEEPLYTDAWLDVRVADVELPDGRHLDHRLIRTAPGAGAVVTDERRRVLLIWRHRFITDSWGWEIPIGKIEDGEEPATAAAREVEEETGWRPGPLRPLVKVQPTNGISDSVHHVFRADSAVHLGPPTDGWEAERIEWVPLSDIPRLVGKGDIVSGTSMAALLYTLTER